MNFDASIVIDRPQREVFAFVTDVANMARIERRDGQRSNA